MEGKRLSCRNDDDSRLCNVLIMVIVVFVVFVVVVVLIIVKGSSVLIACMQMCVCVFRRFVRSADVMG